MKVDGHAHPGRVSIMGLALDPVTESGTVEHILGKLRDGRGGWVITANLDHLRRFQADEEYRGFCREAELIVADGRPLLWAARVQGTPLPGIVAGSNLIHALTEAVGREKRRVFFLGGDPGTAEKAASILSARHGIEIAGTLCPEMGFEYDEEQRAAIDERIAASGADIVYIALGSPKQERLISESRHLLPGAWWIGVGIAFSFVSGDVPRAPRWAQRVGLEWLHRLRQEPQRLFKRYIVQGLPFALRLLLSALTNRLRGRGAIVTESPDSARAADG